MRRILQRGDEPLIYHRESLVYDPTRPIVEAELDVTALRDMFEGGAGAGPKRGELILHASSLTESEAPHLQQPAGHAGVGARAHLLRVRREAAELGLLHLPRRPAAVPRQRRGPGP